MSRIPFPQLPRLDRLGGPIPQPGGLPNPLPRRHKVVGVAAMTRLSTLNGLAFPFLIGGIMTALAAQFGPTHTQLALLGAIPIVTGLVKAIACRLLRDRDLVHTLRLLWMVRAASPGSCVSRV